MANLYHLPELPPPGVATIGGDVAHHLLRVLRVRPGDEVVLCDGKGRTSTAEVQEAHRRELRALVGPPMQHRPVRPRVTIAFACPRPARADWLLEHGTEVGVATFAPVWTARSRPQTVRLDRWQKIAASAAGQCGRAHLPVIREPVELSTLLAEPLPARKILAAQDGAPLLSGAPEDDAVALIGPEGGFDREELDAIAAAGFEAAALGPHILRTETAALVAAAALLRAAE